ncbi:choice-of-anchor Q domain-containing protein [Spirosoma sp. 209]|uniref:choice-of-anchor Q domain-containing protein n=1 Tax=Spirosoma sp. 209 TaxID=1955701 RepID=UPI001117796E|nr:choice-of-anchor Q domain-containing protein [Spirosoma sp. 209]
MKHICTALFFFLFLSAHCQPVIYVTVGGAGDKSGSSWSNALPDNQLSTYLATATDRSVFWLSAGLYKPGILTNNTFLIPSGVRVYGGFTGTEVNLSDRVLTVPSSTTLSGEEGDPNTSGDNNQYVVTLVTADTTTLLNGLTITRGSSAGIINRLNRDIVKNSQPRISHCSIIANRVGMVNEGLSRSECSPNLTDCVVENNQEGGLQNSAANLGVCHVILANCSFNANSSDYGGAISSDGYQFGSAKITATNCRFTNNWSRYGGGAIYVRGNSSSSLALSACLFTSNQSTGDGGGVSYALDGFGSGTATMLNCLFANNSARYGGSLYYTSGSRSITPLLTNCTVASNLATLEGGAIYAQNNNNPTLTSCIVWNNSAAAFPAIRSENASVLVNYSNIQGGFTGTGNISTDPLFADTPSGNYHLLQNSPSINTGDPNSTTATVSVTDIAGNPRIGDSLIDMGAYEFKGLEELYTLADGNWNDPSVWSRNRLPAIGERVQLRHHITLPTAYQAWAGQLIYNARGLLVYSNGATIRLMP